MDDWPVANYGSLLNSFASAENGDGLMKKCEIKCRERMRKYFQFLQV